jgi:hypothetical protein
VNSGSTSRAIKGLAKRVRGFQVGPAHLRHHQDGKDGAEDHPVDGRAPHEFAIAVIPMITNAESDTSRRSALASSRP